MTFRRRSLLPVLAAALAAAPAGCGGTSTAHTLTRAQLIARADPICASASEERAKANARLRGATSLSSPQTLATLAETASSVAVYENQGIATLRKLSAPASLARDWRSMLAGLQQLANATAQLGTYAKEKNVKAAEQLLTSTSSTRAQLLVLANRDGFRSCGRND